MSVLTVFFVAVHAFYLYHGSNVVTIAAQDALKQAQVLEDEGLAETIGDERLALFPALSGTVDVNYLDGDQVEAVATAQITTPFLNIGTNLETRVQGPVERFFEQNERE